MATFDLTKIRNLGIIAHIDAGKTTTTDHVLFYSGAKHKLGTVDSGTTETDYDPEEQERGITIYSACIPFKWRDCTINLIDTPGHVDFTAEVERSLRVLDGAVVVFDAQKGVEAQSETVWRQADKYSVPRLAFINKMDVVGANFENAVHEIKDRLEGTPAPLIIPFGSGSSKDSQTPFAGIVDLLEGKAYFFDPQTEGKKFHSAPIPEEMHDRVQHWREYLFEVLTQFDDKDRITTLYLEGKEIPLDILRQVIREQTLARQIQPVLCGSGREHVGIQPLMDAVCHYLPCPLDRPPVRGVHPKKKDKEEQRKPDPKEPLAALVFKIVADSHGDLYFLRIYSGTLKANSRVLNPDCRLFNPPKEVKEFASKIYHIHADPKNREDMPLAHAGDIVGIIGPKDSITGDTLCDPQHPIVLEQIQFAEAVVSMSIEPESSGDKDKLTEKLDWLKREDPTFTWRIDADTGQMLMSGMGILHLEVKRHRLERDFRLKVRVSKPRVSYRETLRKAVKIQGECVKQAGTTGLFAKVTVEFEPIGVEKGIEVINAIPPEALPGEFSLAAEQGIRFALQSGELGYPVIGVKATMRAAQLHEVDSNDIAFQAAGADAVNRALKGNMTLLEPVMNTEVMIPEDYLGPVTADLNARRAEIREVLTRGKLRVIEALVPLAKMFDYSDKVRSLTQGRASWTMAPSAYAPVDAETRRQMESGEW
ncbi:MAG: elongation factor G [Planctomycetes bacterium]|nr:elongation factor G [Planctomycetota bacterium]